MHHISTIHCLVFSWLFLTCGFWFTIDDIVKYLHWRVACFSSIVDNSDQLITGNTTQKEIHRG